MLERALLFAEPSALKAAAAGRLLCAIPTMAAPKSAVPAAPAVRDVQQAPPLSSGFLQAVREGAPPVPAQLGGLGQLLDPAFCLGGHRGMGMNFRVPEQPALLPSYRENTIASFLQAAERGATFVEFDVQVTKDGIPVIWHDNTVLWRQADGSVGSAAIADLTLADFKRLLKDAAEGPPLLRSFYDPAGGLHVTPVEWHCSVEDRLPTLAEVFARVPDHVGFDIEVKMATPDSMPRTPQAEIDRMVNSILDSMGYTANSRRRMMFSSFDPDVCAALRSRQQRIPVFFLSDGVVCHSDPRRCSIQAAVDVALEHQLQGIVLETGALRASPGAVASARRQGLQVLTFGLANNDPPWVLQQHLQLGVQGAIVDDVEGVAAGLLQSLALQAA